MTNSVTIAQARLRLEDPHDSTDANDVLTIFDAFFDGLVHYGAKTGFEPALAASWTTSPDALEWNFTLREGLTFHDGAVCDAQAVCQSLQRMARADKGYTLGAPGVWHQYLGDARIEALTSSTVRIALSRPVADLLDVLVYGYIASPACLARMEAGDVSQPVGTGPYRFESFDGKEMRATRNDKWFGAAPRNGAIRWVLETDASIRQDMLVSGKAGIANTLDFTRSGSISADGFQREISLVPVAIIYLFNSKGGPLRDPRVRRALNLAINRTELIDGVVDGAAVPLAGFVSPRHFGVVAGDEITQDLAEAKRLLADAGHGNGLTLEVDCPTRLPDEAERLTQAVARQLENIGVRFNVHLHQDREAYAHMIRRKEIRDLCIFDSSPLSTFRVLYEKIDARVQGSWWQGYHNAAVEQLLDEGRATVDDTARAAIYRKAYEELQRDPPWLYLYNPLRVTGLRAHKGQWAMRRDSVLDVSMLPEFL
ncbi:peptide ABC transporter substrate-binding protein [Mesorhizobium sp. NBSH29]|uniref:ABC transporter substrate-binding protein n=1 Tax=Mesorhizobium sp. NBSH29 TaxID=2654249 RepID=UPI0018965E45|nr:ABC transporter substrate-binding protein [Mesorhizobium sp. NBSH29]QPC85479.1 peptide ABC transporter substrate-binding protein [Mesorhizobium sp. NBSH29]